VAAKSRTSEAAIFFIGLLPAPSGAVLRNNIPGAGNCQPGAAGFTNPKLKPGWGLAV